MNKTEQEPEQNRVYKYMTFNVYYFVHHFNFTSTLRLSWYPGAEFG